MYRISQLAEQVGLSRSTLLYYEKLGLIQGTRQANGYRMYTDKDVQRVRLLQQLQAGGLTLEECLECLESKIDRNKLLQRLNALDEEIQRKQKAKELLSAMLGMNSMRDWHQEMEENAPSAHMEWLIKQGFSEKQALRLKWLSKDMNEHEQYMADFEQIFAGLKRLGPGSEQDTLRALSALSQNKGALLEVGCGKGIATGVLASNSEFRITALDNDEASLRSLQEGIPVEKQVNAICASMTDMPFEAAQFDVIWSEGSAYIMGVENALKSWKAHLKPSGYLVVSDLVWLTDNPDSDVSNFYQKEYPDMVTVDKRIAQMRQAGYEVVETFTLSQQSWNNFVDPLVSRVDELESSLQASQALTDMKSELHMHQNYLHQYGYQMFVLRKM
ncbi:MerR family transcriptional regulator [Vibrio coralliilyticus]|uniref:MerR family transcriptional regulator n=1 Tax=Vibrio coralliilyticus TaxID=190893 RepID=UPI000BAC22F7|nr:MerR family transcriptional regulator [Vibrio coralliilyticus]NOI74689.1 MerR family transcriptional regulator [Vibrio coralliilyticus]PAW05277.1 methyltransferase [Vibrio coralliilyticus]